MSEKQDSNVLTLYEDNESILVIDLTSGEIRATKKGVAHE